MTEICHKLTEYQLKAVALLSEGKSPSDIATELGVSIRTIQRWQLRPDIKAAIAQSQAKTLETIEEALAERYKADIEQMVRPALDSIKAILEDADSKNSDKLRAAQIIGKWYGLEKPIAPQQQQSPEINFKSYLLSLSNEATN